MADVDFDDFDAGHGAPVGQPRAAQRPVSRIINIVGAVSSVVLVVWLGLWGYDVAVRDVNGVPVIRAMEGPMRIAPENPGGTEADHQGLAVNDVAAIGIAAPPPETLTLAPRPVELTEEDVAGLTGAPLAAAADAPAPVDAPAALAAGATGATGATGAALQPASAETVLAPPPVAALAPLSAPDPQQGAVELALAEAMSQAAQPDTDDAVMAALAPETTPDLAAATAPPAGATRPRARPASAAAAAQDTEAAAQTTLAAPLAPAVAAAELDPASLTPGTRLVQLGAFDTPEVARAEWARLLNANPDLLAGRAIVVQSASSGGRAFFRLRADGIATEAEARELCSALLERNATCIPVLHR